MIETPRLQLLPLDAKFLEFSLAGDRAAAEKWLGATIDEPWFDIRWLMELRLEDLRENAALLPWLLRGIVLRDERRMIGHIGFHDSPGAEHLEGFAPDGAEFGYEVYPNYRRHGYAREAVCGLLAWAERVHQVPHFVASVSPTNIPSRNLILSLGFELVGSQIDEIDGPEDIFVRTGAPRFVRRERKDKEF